VPEDKLIQIDLELSSANAMVGADQPLLEVANRAISEWHGPWQPVAGAMASSALDADIDEPTNCDLDAAPRSIGQRPNQDLHCPVRGSWLASTVKPLENPRLIFVTAIYSWGAMDRRRSRPIYAF
jgi:hypothetical protein